MSHPLGASDPVHLGELMRRERTRRQLTLPQASVATRIRASHLAAMENGEIDRLPPSVFAIGLIRTYAQFLELDAEPYVAAVRGSGSGSLSGPYAASRPSYRPPPALIPRYFLPITIAAILLTLSGYLYQQYLEFQAGAAPIQGRPIAQAGIITTPLPTPPPEPTLIASATPIEVDRPTPTLPPTPLPTALLAIPLRAPAVTPTVAVLTATPNAAHGVRIDALISGRVWVQVETDGTVAYVGIIAAGEKRSWNASGKLLLWSGNAGNMSVTFNGKPLGLLGAPGEVVKVTWTATD